VDRAVRHAQGTGIGAQRLGELDQLGPIWLMAIALAILGFGLYYVWRWLLSSFRPTTLERVVFACLAALYLSSSGAIAVQWYEFFRTSLGVLVYDVAFRATQDAGAGGLPEGDPVDVHCDLAPTVDPNLDRCVGLEMTMSYLRVGSEREIASQGAPQGFLREYFALRGSIVQPGDFIAIAAPDARQALLDSASDGMATAAGGLPLALMALLESVIMLLFALATLALSQAWASC
jgi:hypothetical protein